MESRAVSYRRRPPVRISPPRRVTRWARVDDPAIVVVRRPAAHKQHAGPLETCSVPRQSGRDAPNVGAARVRPGRDGWGEGREPQRCAWWPLRSFEDPAHIPAIWRRRALEGAGPFRRSRCPHLSGRRRAGGRRGGVPLYVRARASVTVQRHGSEERGAAVAVVGPRPMRAAGKRLLPEPNFRSPDATRGPSRANGRAPQFCGSRRRSTAHAAGHRALKTNR